MQMYATYTTRCERLPISCMKKNNGIVYKQGVVNLCTSLAPRTLEANETPPLFMTKGERLRRRKRLISRAANDDDAMPSLYIRGGIRRVW